MGAITCKLSEHLYTGAIHLYQGVLRVASLRNAKAMSMLKGRRESLTRLRHSIDASHRPVWVHAASLGEFEQGRPLMERLRREHPDIKIVLSFYSPSGYKLRHNWEGADSVVYLPADTPAAMRSFIDTLNPSAAIFVKYEFWGNCLHTLKRRGVPVYLISAVFRPNQIFFRRGGGVFRRMLECYTHIYVQDSRSAQLLERCGLKGVTVAGDTRFDRVTDIMRSTRQIPALERLKQVDSRLLLMAGSSWEGDEAVYFPWLKNHRNEVLTVIAPHEFDFPRLARMKEALAPELRVVFLSEVTNNPDLLQGADCLIIDCFGLLSSAYRYADIAYIGGGFGAGIHNINEAAVYGIPVVFGPRHDKFIEARELIEAGGGFCVYDATSFANLMSRHLTDEGARKKAGNAAGAYIHSKLGATDIIYSDIFGSLPTDEMKQA